MAPSPAGGNDARKGKGFAEAWESTATKEETAPEVETDLVTEEGVPDEVDDVDAIDLATEKGAQKSHEHEEEPARAEAAEPDIMDAAKPSEEAEKAPTIVQNAEVEPNVAKKAVPVGLGWHLINHDQPAVTAPNNVGNAQQSVAATSDILATPVLLNEAAARQGQNAASNTAIPRTDVAQTVVDAAQQPSAPTIIGVASEATKDRKSTIPAREMTVVATPTREASPSAQSATPTAVSRTDTVSNPLAVTAPPSQVTTPEPQSIPEPILDAKHGAEGIPGGARSDQAQFQLRAVHAPITAPSEQAASIARQILATATPLSNGVTEVTLSPEELGRVRMVVSDGERGLVIAVSAERPETQDLMRRHISSLERQFEDAGMSDVAFSFTSHSGSQGDAPKDEGHQTHIAAAPLAEQSGEQIVLASHDGRSGLDLRL